METTTQTTSSDDFGDGVSAETKKIARDLALKFGLFLGIIGIALTLIFYLFNPLYSIQMPFLGSISFVVSIAATIYFILEIRKSVGGFWDFRFSFSSILVMFLVSTLMLFLFNVILYNVIDAGLGEKMKTAYKEKMDKEFASKGVSGDQANTQIQMGASFIPDYKSIKSMLIALFSGVVGSIIISLILAAIFKKNRPLFSPSA